MYRPRIFISHCEKKMAPTEYAMRIISLLGCEPVIAERQAKGSKSVNGVVNMGMNSCDAVIVIATADLKNGKKYSPSSGVSLELGKLKNSRKFKSKYFIVKQDNVDLSAMNEEARYTFSDSNYGPIAEAILIELGSMELYTNSVSLHTGDREISKFIETLFSLRKAGENGHLNNPSFKLAVQEFTQKLVDLIIQK